MAPSPYTLKWRRRAHLIATLVGVGGVVAVTVPGTGMRAVATLGVAVLAVAVGVCLAFGTHDGPGGWCPRRPVGPIYITGRRAR